MRIGKNPIYRFVRRRLQSVWVSTAFIALLATGSTLLVFNNVPLVELAENHLVDIRVALLSPLRPQSDNIVVILINDQTLSGQPYRSPLDRGIIADLLTDLEQRSVAAIGLNVLIDRPTELHKDQQLYERLRSLKVPIVLSSVSNYSGFSEEQVQFSQSFIKDIPTGLSLIYRDTLDHTVRASLLRFREGGKQYLGFAATLATIVGVELPSDDMIQIDYRNGPTPTTSPFPILEAHQLGVIPRSFFTNRVVLIGTDLSKRAKLRTPFSTLENHYAAVLPGVVIEAHILSQLIEQRSMKRVTAIGKIFFTLFMAIAGLLLSLVNLRLWLKVFMSVVLLPAAWIGAFLLFIVQGTLVPIVIPTIAFTVAIIITSGWQWHSESKKKEKIYSAFGKFLAPAVVEQIMFDPNELELGGEVREVSFMFTDLEGFTELTESNPPQVMVRLVNSYLEEACDIVIEHGGTIDKIVGDALHVMFNAPVGQPDHAQRAVTCALAIDRWSQGFRQRQREQGIELGITRIGVNTGRCIVGNFGGKKRFDYTAHGDAINSAARLEAINQRLGTRISVSQATVDQCEGIHFRSVAILVLRGKKLGIQTHLPVTAAEVDDELSTRYERAYRLLSNDDIEATGLFKQLAKDYPDDPLVQLHLTRLESGEHGSTLIVRKK